MNDAIVGTVAPVANAKHVAADARNVDLYQRGEELGYGHVELNIGMTEALKLCRTTNDRNSLRAGFVTAYAAAMGVDDKAANNRFDYLAKKFTPGTSRKAASNKRKAGAGRKEKTDGKGDQLNASAIAQRLAAVLHYVAKAQAEHVGDEDILNMLGEIAAICGGVKKGNKRK